MLIYYQFIAIVIFVTSPALALPELADSKPSNISKIASTHPVEETIYNVTRGRERVREGWALCCHCSVGVHFVGFHEPRAGFGWVAWLDAAPPTGRVYSGPDHLNIVSKSRGDCDPQSSMTSARWQALTL